MKNYIKLSVLSLAVATLATSCDMDAPSISTLDESSVYSVYGLAEREVMSINVSFGETNSYRGRFLPYYGVSSDVEVPSGSCPSLASKTDDKQSLCNYATLATNGQMNTDNNAYAKFYEGIERANLAIEGIRKYGDIENNPDMKHLLGEALTMRAVIYNDLIKGWGDVPARFTPNSSDNVYMPRASKDEIYIQLLNDLKEAEGYCYWPNENSITKTTERVSKSFVKGLRARIALYACGYALHGDGYRRSTNEALSQDKMMAIVKEECEDIINGGHNQLGEFKQNFLNLCQDITTAGLESLWEIPFSEGRGRVLYTWGVKHGAKDQYTQQAQGGVNGPTPNLFYDYSVNDVRRNITCVPYQWSKTLTNESAPQELRKVTQWCFGKLRYEWMNRTVTSTNDDGVNWQYMRLADVYLMAAEAENYLGNTSTAWSKYMKPVLDRVLPSNEVSALGSKYTASKDAFQEGIMDQRAFEFAGEALRRADLVRWGKIDQKMSDEKKKLQELAERQGAYSDLPEKLYYKIYDKKTDNDVISKYDMYVGDGESGEALVVYGLNHGDKDDVISEYNKKYKELIGKVEEASKLLEDSIAQVQDGRYESEKGEKLSDDAKKALISDWSEQISSNTTTITSYSEKMFTDKGWLTSKGANLITSDYWDGLYINTPSTNYLWPIWQTFIDKSNNMLNNDGNYGQLND